MCLERERESVEAIYWRLLSFFVREIRTEIATAFPSDMPLFTNSSTCFTAVNSSHRNSTFLSNSHKATTTPRILRFPQVSILNLFFFSLRLFLCFNANFSYIRYRYLRYIIIAFMLRFGNFNYVSS